MNAGMRSSSRRGWLRPSRLVLAAIGLLLALLAGKAWQDTMAEPRVRRLTLELPGLAMNSPPIRLALLSDVHVAGPDMPPARVARIVRQVNALHPDLVLIAGDFVSDRRLATRHYTSAQAAAPLGELRPRWATIAVPGNHDHWRDAAGVRRELARQGIIVLANEARRFGPLAVGGLDDDFTGHADLAATVAALDALGGVPVMLSHSPDPFPDVPGRIGLVLAGHTHCGQIRYPWGGTPATMSRYGDRYACGVVRESGKVLVVTGGLGTSVLPFRFGTRPEVSLIELRPARAARPAP
jgi:predicted MPP superfamily phosphohydrolase